MTLGQSGFFFVAAEQNDAIAFQTFASNLSTEGLNAAIKLAKLEDNVNGFYAVMSKQPPDTVRSLLLRLSPDTINEAGRVPRTGAAEGCTGFLTAILFQDYAVLRMLFDIACPFNLMSSPHCESFSEYVDKNNELSPAEKVRVKKELTQILHFIQNPDKAVLETPKEFMDFVSKYLPDFERTYVDYAKWQTLLRSALKVCDPKNKPVYDVLLALMSQAYFRSQQDVSVDCENDIYLDLFKLSGPRFLNANSNAFVGDYLTRLGSPLEKIETPEQMSLPPCDPGLAMTLATQNYNAMYLKGLSHLETAVDGKSSEASVLLQRRLCSFNTEQKSDLSFVDAVEQLQARIHLFDCVGWDRLSLQFQKALDLEVAQAEAKQIIELALMKVRIEKAEPFLEIALPLFERFSHQLRAAIQAAKQKERGLLKDLFKDPYEEWLKTTLDIANDCMRMSFTHRVRVSL